METKSETPGRAAPAPGTLSLPSIGTAFRTWLKIGVLSFGGPAAQIALMHRLLVEENAWLTERQFLSALSFCMLLPGPEAMQLATYAGWRLHGVRGGLIAGLLFVAPGALVVLTLAVLYAAFGNLPLMAALFLGVKAAVLAIVVEALIRIARRALKTPDHWLTAAFSFIAIFFLALPFPLIILLAALYGGFRGVALSGPNDGDGEGPDIAEKPPALALRRTAGTIALWLAIWLAPLAALAVSLGGSHILVALGLFFSKLAVVTFGGAYAVLAYMAQDVVITRQWLSAGEMMDGLGLAETTPGPLILVTEFVGFLAAFNEGAGLSNGPRWALALAGAATALWATFAPCFLWIFAGAPYLGWITAQPRLNAALSAITAAVVGVIFNLALWFALHVFFAEVARREWGVLQLWAPLPASLDGRVVVLALFSAYLLIVRKWGIFPVLAASALLALVIASLPF